MRTAELLRWDWSMIDLAGFAFCTIKRAKTGEVQTLEMPEVLRPFVRVWWERAGKQAGRRPRVPGPPGSEGREGQEGAGDLLRLPHAPQLWRAGVVRLPPVTGGDSKPAPNPADPFYFDTPVSRRVNFHSMRRA